MSAKSIAQPGLIDSPPTASQIAKVDRALKQGRAADWILERLNGMEARKEFTDALKEATEYVDPKGHQSSFLSAKLKDGESATGRFIEAETNYIYGKVGISREERKAIKKGVKRDHFTAGQLHAVGLAEQHVATIWKTAIDQQWTRDKAKQARTEVLNLVAGVQHYMKTLTGTGA